MPLSNTVSKLGNAVWCFNLPRSTCKEFRTPLCDIICYAKYNNFLFPHVIKGLENNLKESAGSNFDVLIMQQIKNIGNVKRVRIHSSGDFYNKWYFYAWKRIAQLFPNVYFLAYTRNIHIDFSDLPNNFRVFFSWDESTKKINTTCKQFSYLDTTNKEIPRHMATYRYQENTNICNSHCYSCWHCFKTKKNIAFLQNMSSRTANFKARKKRELRAGQLFIKGLV